MRLLAAILLAAISSLALLTIGAFDLGAASPAADPAETYARGLELLRQGHFDQAASDLKEAARLYEAKRDYERQAESLLSLAEACLCRGTYGEAERVLESVLAFGGKISARIQAGALAGLGRMYTERGSPEKARALLEQALEKAGHEDLSLLASVRTNLGNLLLLEGRLDEAVAAYREAGILAQKAGQALPAVRALSNGALACAEHGRPDLARDLVQGLAPKAAKLPGSYEKVLVLTNIGLTWLSIGRHLPGEGAASSASAIACFEAAMATAEEIENPVALSYAAGHLGGAYEQQGEYGKSLDFTRQAVFSAQKARAPESLYLWQWQAGRVLRNTGDADRAIVSYRNAIYALQSVRREMETCPGTSAVSFKESVGPLYSEFVDLLLTRAKSRDGGAEKAADLKEAREVVELLKVAELRDYFQDECVAPMEFKATSLDELSKGGVVVVYPIVLKDRTELLVSAPSGLKQVTIAVPSDVLEQEILQFRRKLEKCTTREYFPHARRLYEWLIRPLEKELEGLHTKTMVFVPDGALRTIPLGALHDGTQFLISKYALAVTPGLSLTDPRPINRSKMRILAAGLTEGVQGFPPLPNVSIEIKAIQDAFGCDLLLNHDFKTADFEKQLKDTSFSVIHIGSHGQFDSDLSKTFLLTYNGKLTMDQLGEYVGLFRFRNDPLELLTLSACETAAGDQRAALGLAAVGIKAGARSAVATLWHVNDEASSLLVAEFYRNLKSPSLSRAEALRAAQLGLINNRSYQHPAYWSPFLLINNWL